MHKDQAGVRFTEWMNPKYMVTAGRRGEIKSCYGEVNGRQWCEKEVERMHQKGTNARIITNDIGDIAVERY